MKSIRFLVVFGLLVLCMLQAFPSNPVSVLADTQTQVVVREGNDFATRVLGDAWDMGQFSDVSLSLNNSGRYNLVRNFQVSGGIFSAYSTSTNYALFYILFPGFAFTMHIGKVGDLYPISTAVYHCLYIRMRVASPMGDSWYVAWQPDANNVVGPDNGGQTWGAQLHSAGLPAGSWRIYSVDLANPPGNPGYFYESWTARPFWKGLRIHPTNTPNVLFEVDWVRLTDCVPVPHGVNWTPISGQNRLWAGIGAPQKDIMITDLTPGQFSYSWDVQGLEPREYFIGVEANGVMTWLNQSLHVEATPVLRFIKPSPFSGEDYATQAGNPWDFSSTNSLVKIDCATWSVTQGLLILDTLPPRYQPPSCVGAGSSEADPRMYLRLPTTGPSGSQYRYLSFFHSIDGTQAVVADGMIGRLIWKYGNCTQVSQAIPYDVGWHTYTIDLYNPALGLAEEAVGCGRDYWINAGQISSLRFDPNENWTGNLVSEMTFHQQFDWVRLTKMDQATQGVPFPLRYVSPNRAIVSFATTFYYTTDPASQPTQHLVKQYISNPPLPVGPFRAFLPLVMQPDPLGLDGRVFWWETNTVPSGTYYICGVVNDGYNQAIYCSDAPVQVVAP